LVCYFVLANWYPSLFLELGAMLWSFRSYHILFLLFFFFFLSSVKSLSDTFFGDALIKLYETL
jgi:hypothetical protein